MLSPKGRPVLIDRHGARADGYARVAPADAGTVPLALVPIEGLEEAARARGNRGGLGVEASGATPPSVLLPLLGRVDLIALAVPGPNDGRALSLGRIARRAGYAGTLRLVGPLVSDGFPGLLALGFDEVELPAASAARQPPEQWAAALARTTTAYQRGTGAPNALDARRSARLGGAQGFDGQGLGGARG